MKKTVLLGIYCLLFIHFIYGQNTPVTSKDNLPKVSDEVYNAIAQFYEYDKNVPLNAVIAHKKKNKTSVIEKIVFTGPYNSRVPSYLIIPKKSLDKYPIVLIADGIYGSKDRWFEEKSWPKGKQLIDALLNEGIAVMLLDAVYHGERAADYDYKKPPWLLSQPYEGIKMVSQTAIEYRRAMDYLSTRPEINISKIGMLGLSMGGIIAYQVMALDERIETVVIGVAPSLKDYPKLQPIAPTTFASRSKVRSFMNFMGTKDGLYTIPEAKMLFNRVPTTNKTFIEFNAGHEPPIDYIEMAKNWFVKTLNEE
ncbi:alpha/beta hydrolase family protein [Seonamhaeicola marinus]|uniref:Dienelactone hydrolase domain-containing protein n=1 Tax=Seonamhaeicola marinus TaxID=1912246 RepID=A0A5D0HSF9_9FLAO|nr:dienelactone hydrolase family protein [Seonamhaeicola marinus]TYA74283.1 hypothetical protein FUA24_13210 [Seonamhaeicola marinus]